MRDNDLVVPACLLILVGLVLAIARAFYTRGLNAGTVGLVAGSLMCGLGVMSTYAVLVQRFKRIDDSEAGKRIRGEANILIVIGLLPAGFGLTLASLCR